MKGRLSPKLLRRAHRWLGLAFSLVVFASAGSGVLHTVMARNQSPPPPARPGGRPLDPARVLVPLREALARLPEGARGVDAVNLRVLGATPHYQVYTRGAPRPAYIDAETGAVVEGRDEDYAAQIASDFLGGEPVTAAGYLTRFDREYVNIFRILPVYRFDVGDARHTRVYVSTTTGSVTRHTDDSRQFEADLFGAVHKWNFIRGRDARDAVLVTLMGGVMAASALGVALFLVTSRPSRRVIPPRASASASIAATSGEGPDR